MADAPEVVPPPTEIEESMSPLCPQNDSSADLSDKKLPFSDKKGYSSEAESPKPDRTTPKFPVEEHDRTMPKYALEEDSQDNGDSISQFNPPQDYNTCRSIEPGPPEEYQRAQTQPANQDGEDWQIGFWDCCSTGSLCLEAAACPCILAGRRHLRIKNTKPTELTSTNGYCFGCFFFTIPLIPFYWVFTMSTRREIRYKYSIRGSNRGDCMRSACCPYCALVQEEREILLREDQKSNAAAGGNGGYGQRKDAMVYQPG